MMACWGGTFVAGRTPAGAGSDFLPRFSFCYCRFDFIGLLSRSEGNLPRLDMRQFRSVLLLGLIGVPGYDITF